MATNKPTKTLTQLEEEPETGFFGCTYSEILTVLRKTIIITLIFVILMSIFVVRWEVSGVLGIIFGIIIFYILIKKTSRNRADKPLYYHKHLSTYKTGMFIQPKKRYQRERNSHVRT